jgi:eukaryotic-like serine/threonine-protein kinase
MRKDLPSHQFADRNLLFGVVALQIDFVSREALVTAMNAWVLAKHRSIGDILVEQGSLPDDLQNQLEVLVEAHIQRHNGDPHRSLVAVGLPSTLQQELESVVDGDLHASLAAAGASSAATVDLCGPRTEPGMRYEVLRPHARGGLGVVSVARDTELGREVALKEMQDDHSVDPVTRGRFLREAEITGGLEHPGVVPVYGLGRRADGRPYYAMRLIRGETLLEAAKKLARSAPGYTLRELLTRFVAVCNAVAYAHSRGVIHRDLKPANVMLGPYGETLVVDWGLAKVVGRPAEPGPGDRVVEEGTLLVSGNDGSVTRAGTLMGTPAYMSPEQAAGRLDEQGPATDVYGLGATLYAVLTGQGPIEGCDTTDALERVRQGTWLPPRVVKPSTPKPLDAICRKAMAMRPAERYQSALVLAADVDRWLADEPVSAYRESAGQRVGRWGRRHKPLVAGTAALLLSAVVALGLGLMAVSAEQRKTKDALRAEERARAEEAKRRAQTRQALDAMSSEVVEDWLAKQSELTVQQRNFLEQALVWYQDFANDTEEDEAARAGAAAACLRVGSIQSRLGQAEKAESAYRRARELYGQLASDFPDQPDYVERLGKSDTLLGTVLTDLGRAQDAESALREALTFEQRLVQEFPNQSEFREDLAAGYNGFGALLNQTGRPKEAENAYRESLALRQRLVQDFPDRSRFRELLARDYSNLARLLAVGARTKEAEGAYQESLALRQRLFNESPNQPDFQHGLAVTHINLGELYRTTRRPTEAEREFREAVVLQEPLVRDFPNRPEYRLTLAGTHNNLAIVLKTTNRKKEAEAEYREALGLRQRLLTQFPDQPKYRDEMATGYSNLANLLRGMDRSKEGEATFQAALALYRRLVVDFPDQPEYHVELANALSNSAGYQLEQHDPTAAWALLQEAQPHSKIALQTNPRHTFFQTVARDITEHSAEAYLQLGDHPQAAFAAERLIQGAVDPPGDLSNAARYLCRCVRLAEQDVKLSEARRAELASHYINRALATLQQAVAKGYNDADKLKRDTDLGPLRTNDDFKKLLAGLESHGQEGKR